MAGRTFLGHSWTTIAALAKINSEHHPSKSVQVIVGNKYNWLGPHCLGTTLRISGRSWSRCLLILSKTSPGCHVFPAHAHQQRLPLLACLMTTNGMTPAWWKFAFGFGAGRTYRFPRHSDRFCPTGFRLPLQPLPCPVLGDIPKPFQPLDHQFWFKKCLPSLWFSGLLGATIRF